MSWNIQTPGDYINGPLTVVGATAFNSNVGIKTAAGANPLTVRASDTFVLSTGGSTNFTGYSAQVDSGAGVSLGAFSNSFGWVGTSTNHYFEIRANNVAQQKIEPLGIFSWYDGAGGTRMTLNATGLAIGDTAFSGTRLTLRESATNPNALAMTNRNATQTWRIGVDVAAVDDKILGFYDSTSTTFRMQLTDTGNLGIGVTPSAWSTMLALQVRGASFACDAVIHRGRLITNAFYDGSGYKYIQTNFAGMFVQNSADGSQAWFTAPSGTAGNAATFTQAMTLDVAGNLLLGTTTSPTGTKVGSIAKLGGVSVEGTNYINVSTTQVALARSIGTGALFFVAGYNTTGGAQGWWLVASTGASVATVIASQNNTTLTVAFTQVSGVLNMNTTSGTVAVTAFSITN